MVGTDRANGTNGAGEWYKQRRLDAHSQWAVTVVELVYEFLNVRLWESDGTNDFGILANDA